MRNSLIFWTVIIFLIIKISLTAGPVEKRRSMAAKKQPEWVIDDSYRLGVTVDPGRQRRHETPVSVHLDFSEILTSIGVKDRLDKNSIRIVQYDPVSGHALPYLDGGLSYAVPYQLSHNFYYQDSGNVWWRIKNEDATHFYIYFDTAGKGPKQEPATIALIGNGDNVLFNNGRPGPLDVSMSSTARFVDWDGDGKKDLLVGSHQTHEYGMFDGPIRSVPAFIYFFKNVGTVQEPIFAPGYQIKDLSGAYVLKELGGGPSAFDLVDWNHDGKLDIVARDISGSSLYVYENTGQWDANHLPILKPPREIVKLKHGSDYTDNYFHENFRFVDWRGQGRFDILYSMGNYQNEPGCDATKKVCHEESAEAQFLELFENEGLNEKGEPIFAAPKIVRVASGDGLPLTTFGANGADYSDWNGDGKPDLIVGDMQNDPQGASRVLMFQNIGTRLDPKFLMGRPIVSRVEDFDLDPNSLVVDFNGDGIRDLLLLDYGGWVKIYTNTNPDPKGLPRLDQGRFVEQTHPKITGRKQTRTTVADWNGDGRLDLVQGGVDGWVTFYENVGTNIDPIFKEGVRLQAGGKDIRMINGLLNNPQGYSEPNAGYTVPVVADCDGDGDLDLIVGDMRGYQTYFENIGTRSKPVLAEGQLIEVDGQPLSFGWRDEVAVGDIDGDGKIEIVSTAYTDRHVFIYKPTPVQDDPKVLKVIKVAPVKLDTGEDLLPFYAGGNNNGDYMLKLVDWNNDGKLDLFVGTLYNVWYYENVGTKTAPRFRDHGKMMVEGKPLMVSSHAGSVEVVDWNGDGRKDLIIGGESGWTFYFERSFLEGNLPTAAAGSAEVH